MFVAALIGVGLGFIFLVTALVTQTSTWAWGCIAACLVAAVVLVIDMRRRRQDARGLSSVESDSDGGEPSAGENRASEHDPGRAGVPFDPAVQPGDHRDEPGTGSSDDDSLPQRDPDDVDTAGIRVRNAGAGGTGSDGVAPEGGGGGRYGAVSVEDDPHPEEDVPPAAAAALAESDHEVFVVDEQPLYHTAFCPRVGASPTMTLPVREAVDLGFAPCAVCAPVRAVLAGLR